MLAVDLSGSISSWLDDLDIIVLQKIFYLLSINLLILGTLKFFFKLKKESKTFGAITRMEKTVKTVDLSVDPEHQGEIVAKILLWIRKELVKMKDYFSKMSKTQIVSIIIMIISGILGILVVSVPQLAQFEQYIVEIGVVFGGASFTGAFAVGKDVASLVKHQETSSVKSTIKTYKTKLANLETRYKDVIEAYNDVAELGGELTYEQKTQYNTYATQKKSLEAKIASEEQKLSNSTTEDKKVQ